MATKAAVQYERWVDLRGDGREIVLRVNVCVRKKIDVYAWT
jgi:hypothetical protein